MILIGDFCRALIEHRRLVETDFVGYATKIQNYNLASAAKLPQSAVTHSTSTSELTNPEQKVTTDRSTDDSKMAKLAPHQGEKSNLEAINRYGVSKTFLHLLLETTVE